MKATYHSTTPPTLSRPATDQGTKLSLLALPLSFFLSGAVLIAFLIHTS